MRAILERHKTGVAGRAARTTGLPDAEIELMLIAEELTQTWRRTARRPSKEPGAWARRWGGRTDLILTVPEAEPIRATMRGTGMSPRMPGRQEGTALETSSRVENRFSRRVLNGV